MISRYPSRRRIRGGSYSDAVSEPSQAHVPVLSQQVLDLLDPRPGQVCVDCTLGLGGHAALLAERLGPRGRLLCIDLDEANIERARDRLSACGCACDFVCANFADLDDVINDLHLERVDRLLADLGVSSNQLDDPERGFSFLADGPLDMRIDRQQELSALDVVNRLTERELADLIYYNSQERFSRRIAKRICMARHKGRIRSTRHLAEVVASAVDVDPGSRKSRIHPATRTFLALRIAVNNEIGNLKRLLAKAPDVLAPGGRIGIISFHSLEDREVKIDFRARAQEGVYSIVTKRPVIAGLEERHSNPRSRSAKFRVAERTTQPLGPHPEV
jgi:16S rRNA (cytosine1402-N4)-methyltransferase